MNAQILCAHFFAAYDNGEMAEWSKALDSKSSDLKGSQGSNPCLSATIFQNI